MTISFRVPLMDGGTVVLDNPWIVSDPHFGHLRAPEWFGRPVNHTEEIMARWRERVGLNDPVLLLGDIVFSNDLDLLLAVSRLPGRKVLVRGNHDRQTSLWYGRMLGMQTVATLRQSRNSRLGEALGMVWEGHRLQLSHVPRDWSDPSWDINIHGHIHQHKKGSLAYVNACVEHRNYQPVRLLDLLAEAQSRRGLYEGTEAER